jgi:hypothetical protein
MAFSPCARASWDGSAPGACCRKGVITNARQAITESTRQMRKGRLRTGLILANGGVFTYQHVLCLSSAPRKDQSEYPREAPLPIMVSGIPTPEFDERASGAASIEVRCQTLERHGTRLR